MSRLKWLLAQRKCSQRSDSSSCNQRENHSFNCDLDYNQVCRLSHYFAHISYLYHSCDYNSKIKLSRAFFLQNDASCFKVPLIVTEYNNGTVWATLNILLQLNSCEFNPFRHYLVVRISLLVISLIRFKYSTCKTCVKRLLSKRPNMVFKNNT